MAPLALALALAAGFAPCAGAQANRSEAPGPGTDAPQNGSCGMTGGGTQDEVKSMLRAVYDDVLTLSGITTDRPQLVILPGNNKHIAHLRHTNDDSSIPTFEVAVYLTICDVARSRDEVAFVFAHELGHYELKHIPNLESYLSKTVEPTCGGCWNDCCNHLIDTAKMPLEQQADKKGADTLLRSHGVYDAMAGVAWMYHGKDYDWAIGDESHSTDHPPQTQRAEELRQYIQSKTAAQP